MATSPRAARLPASDGTYSIIGRTTSGAFTGSVISLTVL
jgi:hypothetical protein